MPLFGIFSHYGFLAIGNLFLKQFQKKKKKKRTNDNYHHKFYASLKIALVYGSEKSIVKILFKVNLLASLYNSYEGILKNGVAMNITHIESYLYYLKKIVFDINSLLQVYLFLLG